MNLIKLEDQFIGIGEVKGFAFTKIKESNYGYIYQVINGSVMYFEVFKKKSAPICTDFENRIYDESLQKVRYPKSNDFGIWAWTYHKLDKAFEKLNSLSNE